MLRSRKTMRSHPQHRLLIRLKHAIRYNLTAYGLILNLQCLNCNVFNNMLTHKYRFDILVLEKSKFLSFILVLEKSKFLSL